MQKEVQIIISAVSKGVEKTTNSVISGFKKGAKSVGVFNEGLRDGKKIASGLAGHIKALIGAYAGFSAISKSTEIIKNSDGAIFNLQTSVAAANREFKNTGTVEDWETAVQRLSKELVIYSDTALRNAVSRTVDMTKRLGLSKDQMEEVIQRSADLGAGKVELEGAIERVTAALRGEAESAEYLGLTLNENYVKAWYEANKQTEKAWKDLSDIEKAQIRYQVLLEQSNELQGRAAKSAETFGGAVLLVRKEIENAITKNKEVTEAMNDLAQVLRENAGEIGKFIAKLVSMVAKIIEFAVKYKEMLAAVAGTAVAIAVIGKLVTIVKALNAAFVMMTGRSILQWVGSLRMALGAVAAQAGIAGMALKAALPIAAAYAVIQIGKLIKSLWDWRKAAKEAKQAQEDLSRQKKFVNEKAKKQLEELSKEIGKNVSSLDEFNELVKKGAIVYDETAGKWVKAEQTKQQATKASTEQIKSFEEAAKKAYEEATIEAEKYAKQVLAWEEKIKYARMSTQDKIREIGRKGLSEEAAWNDKRLQAEEKLAASKNALRQKDYKLAEKLAKDAESLYADLATEVKRNEGGKDVVVKSIEDTKKVAIAGVQEVGHFVEQIYSEQKKSAENARDEWTETANGIKQQLDDLVQQRKANIDIELRGLVKAQSQINDLIRDETKKIKIQITKEVKTVEKKQTGGMAGFAYGGKLPGYGGGDRIRALLEAGEFVIRKEAVAKYGAALFHALNSMKLKLPDLHGLVKARLGGFISGFSIPEIKVPRMTFATGGKVPAAPTETMTLRLQAGSSELPLNVLGPNMVTRQIVKQFEAELRKMGLSHA